MQQQENKPIAFLKSKKIILRPVQESDLPYFVRWLNDQETTKYLLTYLPIMEVGEKEWFEKLHKNKNSDIVLTLVVLVGDEWKVAGSMGLHRINWKDGTATTGAFIGEEEFRGKGYGTEAKMLLLNYAFNTLNLRKICSSVKSFNGRSKRYNEKCGYKVEGVRKEQFYHDGCYCDEIMLAVFKTDFMPIWEEYKKLHNL